MHGKAVMVVSVTSCFIQFRSWWPGCYNFNYKSNYMLQAGVPADDTLGTAVNSH